MNSFSKGHQKCDSQKRFKNKNNLTVNQWIMSFVVQWINILVVLFVWVLSPFLLVSIFANYSIISSCSNAFWAKNTILPVVFLPIAISSLLNTNCIVLFPSLNIIIFKSHIFFYFLYIYVLQKFPSINKPINFKI